MNKINNSHQENMESIRNKHEEETKKIDNDFITKKEELDISRKKMENESEIMRKKVDQIINEEYKIWKYNAHHLYDTLIIGALEWPSLTVNWLPEIEEQDSYKTQRIIIGTHTNNNEQNYLLICKIKFPKQSLNILDEDNYEYYYNKQTINNYYKLDEKIEIEYKSNKGYIQFHWKTEGRRINKIL